jgi:hypothetical protein
VPESKGPVVAFDPVYKLGQRAQPERAQREQQDLDAWNSGGRADPWHPQPRVMVDNVKVVRGRVSEAVVLRETRKQHYWPIRRCYDPALARDQKLAGKVRVQFVIRPSGALKAARTLGKPGLPDTQAVECLVRSLASLKFPAPPRAEATVALDIGLNPGDLPVKAPEDPPVEPGPGTVDLHAAQAVVAGTAGHRVQQCYAEALTRVPSLWGRMALRAQLDSSGALRELVEVESSFPDPATTACVMQAVRTVAFPPPAGGDLRLVIPFRFGTRPR